MSPIHAALCPLTTAPFNPKLNPSPMTHKIHLIAAARPNFMKIAPLFHALLKEPWADPQIIHTGQHYDLNMSDAFFQDLQLPPPHIHLGVGSGTHAEQTGRVMMAYEKCLLADRPDLVIVVGDVNSTVAATLAAVKLGINVAHLEAGLRSFDRTMPEEINRVVTDALAHILWTPSLDGDENLLREGVSKDKIFHVGNIMLDSLEMLRHKIEAHRVYDEYGLMTTLKSAKNLFLTEPLSYIRFMNLVFNCRMVITDSGGIQEETTYLSIPCLTLRPNTERPITITHGTNQLCEVANFEEKANSLLSKPHEKPPAIQFWDGKTAKRVVDSIKRFLTHGP